MSKENPRTLAEGLEIVVRPMLNLNSHSLEPGTIYVTSCCNRLYAGFFKPAKCRSCEKSIEVVEISTEADLPKALEALTTKG